MVVRMQNFFYYKLVYAIWDKWKLVFMEIRKIKFFFYISRKDTNREYSIVFESNACLFHGNFNVLYEVSRTDSG